MDEGIGARLRMLESAGLIRQAAREPEPEYAFRHVLSLEAAYESMLKQDRRRLHHVVGECLERVLGDSLEDHTSILARHFDEAGDDARALDYLLRAADSAARRYANLEAIALLDRARDVAERSDAAGPVISAISARAGRLREMCGDYDGALRIYDTLAALADARSSASMKCQSLLARAAIFCAPTTRYDAERGGREARDALRLAVETGDRAAESKAYWLLLLVAKFSFDGSGALEAGEASASIARELGLKEQLAYTLNDLYPAYLISGLPERGLRALEEAEMLWRELGNLPLLADTLANLAEMRQIGGLLAQAEVTAREAVRIAESTGSAWGQSYSRGVLAQTLLALGRYGDAMREAETSMALGRQAGFALSQIWIASHIAECLCDLGQPEQGMAVAGDAATAANAQLPSWRGYPLAVSAICAAATGNCAEADRAIAAAKAASSVRDLSALMCALAIVEHQRACGTPEQVISAVDASEAALASFGCRIYTPMLLIRKSESERALGRNHEAEVTARAALARADGMGVRRDLWRVWAALADALRAQRRDGEAVIAEERARHEIAFAADQAGSDNLRQSFLTIPNVARIWEAH